MKKWIVVLTFSSLLSTPILASERSECLKSAWQTLRQDLATCKDMTGMEKDGCRKTASKKSKDAKALCPAVAKSAPSKVKPVKESKPVKDSLEN